MTNDAININSGDNNEDGKDDISISQPIAHSASKMQKTP